MLTLEQWRWAHEHFPGREYQMARIAFCESGWDDGALGRAGELGRLQVMPYHATERGLPPAALHDPEVAGRVGAALLALRPDASDWTAQTCREWTR